MNSCEEKLREIESFLNDFKKDDKWKKYHHVEICLKGILNPSVILDKLFFKENKKMYLKEFYFYYVGDKKRNMALRKIYNEDDECKNLTKEEFRNGLKARLYRTMCSILTEYQCYYLCAVIFGEENVSRDIKYDRLGVDFTIDYMGKKYHIHSYTDTSRAREKRKEKIKNRNGNSIAGIHVDLPYSLNLNEKTIHRGKELKKKFVIYTPEYIEYFKKEIEEGRIKNQNIIGYGEQGFIYKD